MIPVNHHKAEAFVFEGGQLAVYVSDNVYYWIVKPEAVRPAIPVVYMDVQLWSLM